MESVLDAPAGAATPAPARPSPRLAPAARPDTLPDFLAPGAAARYDPRRAPPVPAGRPLTQAESADLSARSLYCRYRAAACPRKHRARKWQRWAVELRNRLVVGNRRLIAPLLRSPAYAWLADRDAEGEALLALVHAADGYRPWGEARFSTYAYTSVRNALGQLAARVCRQAAREAPLPADAAADRRPDPADRRDQRADVLRLLTDADVPLSAAERQALVLRFGIGHDKPWPVEAVAALWGVRREAVRATEAAALDKLRAFVAGGPAS